MALAITDTINSEPETNRQLARDLRWARSLAYLLDAKFSFGGIRFGMDAIVSLIPWVGDAAMTIAGLYPLYVARKHKLPTIFQARMAFNLVVHLLMGAVPWLGDLADVAFKANLRNLALLERAVKEAGLAQGARFP